MTHLVRISIAAVLLSGFRITAEVDGATGYRKSRSNIMDVQSQLLVHFHHGKQLTQNTESEQVFRSALTLYRQGKYDEALAMCIKASSLDASDYRPRALAGYVYAAQRKLKSASEAFAHAIGLQPKVRELYLAKAGVDRLRNAHQDALAVCRKAVEVDPNYAEAYAMLGALLEFEKESRVEAISALR